MMLVLERMEVLMISDKKVKAANSKNLAYLTHSLLSLSTKHITKLPVRTKTLVTFVLFTFLSQCEEEQPVSLL